MTSSEHHCLASPHDGLVNTAYWLLTGAGEGNAVLAVSDLVQGGCGGRTRGTAGAILQGKLQAVPALQPHLCLLFSTDPTFACSSALTPPLPALQP